MNRKPSCRTHRPGTLCTRSNRLSANQALYLEHFQPSALPLILGAAGHLKKASQFAKQNDQSFKTDQRSRPCKEEILQQTILSRISNTMERFCPLRTSKFGVILSLSMGNSYLLGSLLPKSLSETSLHRPLSNIHHFAFLRGGYQRIGTALKVLLSCHPCQGDLTRQNILTFIMTRAER